MTVINEHDKHMSSCVLVDCADASVVVGLTREQRVMLHTLADFPKQTAERKVWLSKSGFEERTFDRYRKQLKDADYVKSVKRGMFEITSSGIAAIANEWPTNSHGDPTQDVAATHPPPIGGEVATGLTTPEGGETELELRSEYMGADRSRRDGGHGK